MAAELLFPAMGTRAHLIVVGGPPSLASLLQARIDELDRKWSRFRPESELSRLNDSAGSLFDVSAETRLLLSRGIEGWHLSGGAFDPTVLGALIRAGYDRTFAELCDTGGSGSSPLQLGCERIELDETGARMPPDIGFDSGGIGKGLAADLVAAEAMASGAEGICVNLGGDVRVEGVGQRGEGWTVALDYPFEPAPVALVRLSGGAVATSTTLKRRWRSAGVDRHHLIDPRSGEPCDSDVSFVSIVADQGWRAEVLAKAVLVNGGPHAFDILGGTGAEGLIVTTDGIVKTTEGLSRYLTGAEPPALVSSDGSRAVA